MKIKISEPVIVAMGPDANTAGWGPYQFPYLWQLPDGRILYTFHDAADSVTTYGSEPIYYISEDQGKTWKTVKRSEVEHLQGLQLPNGDILRFHNLPSIPLEGLELPKPVCASVKDFKAYWRDEIPEGMCKKSWQFFRSTPDNPQGADEEATLNWPKMFLYAGNGVLIQSHPAARMRLAPDGTLWMPHYEVVGIDPETGSVDSLQMSNYLLKSTDNGHTWEVAAYLPYHPASEKEATWEGYNENDIGFAPDGSMFRLIRTHVIYKEHAFEPMLITHSTDGGKTWSDPEEFDFTGVWPAVLTLKCGATLATYGRPGLFLRATDDPSCRVWEDRIELIHSSGESEPACSVVKRATCSYTDMIPLDDHTAGLAYSDFTVKDENGVERKTMMFCTITVED